MKDKKNDLIKKLEKRRLERLKWLESCCVQVVSCAESTLKRIRTDGLSANYSCNHDIEKWSERVHRASYELWLLSDMIKMLEIEEQPVLKVEVQEEPPEEE
tara:strand:+ start:18 stop:320 length:303 start_codon:yes stop_codon:yes gene_type:complete